MDAPPNGGMAHAEQAPPSIPNSPPQYWKLIADLLSQEELPAPLIVADPSEFQERINEFGLVEYWNDVIGDLSNAPVMHFDMVMSLFLMNITIETLALKSFVKAVVQSD